VIKFVSDLRQVCGFSLGSLVSSTNKTDHNNIIEILLKVALNTIKPNQAISSKLNLTFQALRVVCQDMFFSRTNNSAPAQSVMGAPSVGSRTALEAALGQTRSADEKMNVVGDLVDMKVDGPTQLDFSEQVTHSILIFVLLGRE
jgi:hypothetical protein